MNRDDLDEIIETARRDHNPPPPPPRERLWARIDAARAAERGGRRPRFGRSARWALAAAAVLACGIILGRWSGERTAPAPGPASGSAVAENDAASPDDARARLVYDRVAVTVLDRADALLTEFRARTCAGAATPTTLKAWAGSLLAETRLLMDTPAAEEPELGRLLHELELVLAQLAGLSAARCEDDSAWIRTGMERRDTLERLRAVADRRRVRVDL